MARILIKNGRIFDGERFLCADILTDGKTVAKIEPSISDPADLICDATGKIVSAGLIDIHTHLRGISCDKYGMDAALATIPFGVTCAVDAEGSKGDAALLDSLAPRSAVLVSVPIRNNIPDFSDVEARAARYGKYTLGLKIFYDTTGTEVLDIHPLRKVCDYAAAHGWRVMVHCNHSPVPMAEILETLRAGDILTHAYHGGEYHAAEDGFMALKEARARGVIIDAGMAGHVHTDFDVLAKAIAAGATPNTISSDITCLSAYRRGGRYGLTQCMSIFRHLGMAEDDVFRAVTSHAAQAIGYGDVCGRLLPGREADLALLELDGSGASGFSLTDRTGHTVESTVGYRCTMTVTGGNILYKI